MRNRKLIVILICCLLAFVFVSSGISKVLWNHDFERSLAMYRITMSDFTSKWIRILLPCSELIIAVLLLVASLRKCALWLVAILLTSFTTAQLWAMWHGWRIACGCFGPLLESDVGACSVARNIALIMLAFLCLWIMREPICQDDMHEC